MKMKKLLSLLLVAGISFGAIGCQPGSKEKNKSAGEGVQLTIWSPTDEKAIEDWWTTHLAQWNQEHPDITIKREAIDRSDSYAYENKVTAATTSNDLPDILYVDGPNVSYYAANGIIVPMDDCYTQDDLKDFMPSTLQQCTYDNSLYAISATESSVALFYNKDYLDEAGITYPSDTDISGAWTWTQFYENAKKLTTDSHVGANIIMDKGEGLIYALGSFWQENQAPMVDENGSSAEGYLDSQKSIETAEYLAKFIRDGYAKADPIKDEFKNGYAATMLGGSWEIASLEKSDINWGISYFPVSDKGKAVSPTGDWSAAITKNCKDAEKAKEFLKWLMNTENCATYAAAVSKPASRTSSYEKMEGWDSGARALVLWQLQNTGVARPQTPSYAVLSTNFATALLNIFSGADAGEELKVAAEGFNKDYDMYYGK